MRQIQDSSKNCINNLPITSSALLGIDHTYQITNNKRCSETNTPEIKIKRKRVNFNQRIGMSKDLIDLNEENLDVLRNIDEKLGSILESVSDIKESLQSVASSLQMMVDILKSKNE